VPIAEAQIKAGDIAGAKETIVSALKTADLIIHNSLFKCTAQTEIAEAKAMAGDIAGAKETLLQAVNSADSIENIDSKIDMQHRITEVQAKYSISGIPIVTTGKKPVAKISAQPTVPVIKVSDWLSKLDDKSKQGECALNTDLFLDLTGYLTAQHSDDAQVFFKKLYDTAEKIVTAQSIIDKMLKQQASQ